MEVAKDNVKLRTFFKIPSAYYTLREAKVLMCSSTDNAPPSVIITVWQGFRWFLFRELLQKQADRDLSS